MSRVLLFVLIGLAMIVAHGLLILTFQALAPLARQAVRGAFRTARRAMGSVAGGAR